MGGQGWVAAAYGGMSLVTLVAFGIDKSAAGRGARRIPEGTLHLLEFLGGWPGAILGAILFRHKTRKSSYLAVTGTAAALHLAGWWWAMGRR